MSVVEELRRDFLLAGEGSDAVPVRYVAGIGVDGPSQPALASPMAASLPWGTEGERGSCPLDRTPAAIAIGAFDGLHLGHRYLLDRTIADARARGIAAVAVTFDPDPDAVVASKPAPKLLATSDRLRALAASGVDAVLVVPFTRELAVLDHAAFFERILAPYLSVRSVHVGSNFRLGAHGASTLDVVASWGADHGIAVTGHHLVQDGGDAITATRIRALIASGDLDAAARQLGRRPLVRGRVVRGRGDGTKMGFPTANVVRDAPLQMPPDGVYAGWALVEGAVAYPAAINVGAPPMFADNPASASLEATLLGFSGDLYGTELAVLFTERLRPSVTFSSIGALIAQVEHDMETVRRRFGDAPVKL